MKNRHIEQVVLAEDDESPFLAELRRKYFANKSRLTSAERLVYPSIDPAFAFHFARAYHQARKVPPSFIWSSSIWRAYCCLRYDSRLRYIDTVCNAALALGEPGNRTKRMIVNALTCAGLSPEAIGECTGEPSEVIKLYHELFFDFQDRRDNKFFVSKVLNPKGELHPFKANKNQVKDPALLLMNVGYQLGPEAVLKAVGLRVKPNESRSDVEIFRSIKRALLVDSETKAQMGLLDAGDPGFTLAKIAIAEEVKHAPTSIDDDEVMGLTRLSYSQGIMHTFRKIVTADALARLRCPDAQKEAESAKAVADEGSGG